LVLKVRFEELIDYETDLVALAHDLHPGSPGTQGVHFL
jgi:hypothetical protein